MAPAGLDRVGQTVGVELLSEIAYVDIDDITISSFVVFIGMAGDVVTGNDFILFKGEAFEKVVFPSRQGDLVPAPVDGFGGGVESDITYFDQRRFTLVFPPDLGADTGHQFFERKGFDEIIVGPAFETFDSLLYGVAGADENHWNIVCPGPEVFEDVQAAYFGQHDIEKHNIVFVVIREPQAFLTRVRGVHSVAFLREAFADAIPEGRVVFQNKDSHDDIPDQ